jgi:hypothetical protein
MYGKTLEGLLLLLLFWPGMMVHTSNPITQKAVAGGP